MYILAPSVLAADFGKLAEDTAKAREGGASYLHLDVMDGAFVPSISFGMPVIASLRGYTDLVFDVHMMVEDPGRYVESIRAAGADIITVHQEACTHLDRVIGQIKASGAKAGVALNPATPVSTLECVLDQVDMVLVMSVNPGFGGQKFIPYTLDKVRALRQYFDRKGLSTDIQVDGGVNRDTIRPLIEAGANVLVAGSAVFGGDVKANVETFMNIFKEYER
ncbi:ribulose-phosphate 3-epimerase [Clostridium sp. AF18-27]|uniref:Ribulose-phosphate 3-epimerase n=1 Tax=Enterocloster lavalensis TaxID=460384 RepID=A0A1I0ATH1_9FIRM|nr:MULTISPECIES: ribulose-phosphate 3-epimerase [Enterocloster]MBS5607526.1 ribulose-phosphate 3-epimerase [Enterocloster asparagiformis]RHR49069.1 ribulose-phosphate 3-epimerase [Clostridium sp. AF18-27]MCB6343984.1 ribulose-phosphate 3-epimerase [Enterocloster lavalensis]MDR3759847.1 ribulose-phosphate 3-epimerase [Enterocloster sp.]PST32589.1 ribulose-phosphate 3-epimerase [Enterocloster lavalensis]